MKGRPPSTRQEVCLSVPKFSRSGCTTSTVNFYNAFPGTTTPHLLSNMSDTMGQMRCLQCGRGCQMFHERFSPWKSLSWTEYTCMLCYDLHISALLNHQTHRWVDYKLMQPKLSGGRKSNGWVVQLVLPTIAANM